MSHIRIFNIYWLKCQFLANLNRNYSYNLLEIKVNKQDPMYIQANECL